MTEPSPFARLIQRWESRSPLSDPARQAVLALPHTRRTYDRDAYLVREGEAPSTCGLLLSGFAFRQKRIRTGQRQIISVHIPGEFVDLQNALLSVADHNVQSAGRSEMAVVTKSVVTQISAAHPEIARAIWIDTLVDASIFREWVVNVGRRDAHSRIAHLLCELNTRMQAAGLCDVKGCDFPFTQEQIADATGMTSVHTNRVLQLLRRQGLISIGSHRLAVHDWSRLADVGDFGERYLHQNRDRQEPLARPKA